MRKISKQIMALVLLSAIVFGDSKITYAMTNAPPENGIEEASTSAEALDKVKNNFTFCIKSSKEPEIYNNVSIVESNGLYIINCTTEDEMTAAMQYYQAHGYEVVQNTDITNTDHEQVYVTPDAKDSSPLNDAVKENPVTTQNVLEKAFSNKEITVALIDSGIDSADPLFQDRISDKTEDNAKTDDNGHGTLLAKVILADADSYTKILPIKAFNKDGNGTALNIYLAIESAIEKKADIINLSAVGSGTNTLIEKAVQDAKDNNIPIVVSAGNYSDDTKNYYPASYDYPYVIASASDDKQYSDFSDYGDTVDYIVNGTATEKDNIVEGTSISAARFSAYLTNIIRYSKDNNIENMAINSDTKIVKEINDKKYETQFLDKEIVENMLKSNGKKTDADTQAKTEPVKDKTSDKKDTTDSKKDTPTPDQMETDGANKTMALQYSTTSNPSDYKKNFQVTVIDAKHSTIKIVHHRDEWTKVQEGDWNVITIQNGESKNGVQWEDHGNGIDYGTFDFSWDGNNCTITFHNVQVYGRSPYILVQYYGGFGWNYSYAADEQDDGNDGLTGTVKHDDYGPENFPGYVRRHAGVGYSCHAYHIYWTPWQHTVTFNPGSTPYNSPVSNMPGNFVKTYGAVGQIPYNIPTKPGYDFQYWSSALGNYSPGAQYGYDQNGGSIDMTAVWQVHPYTVSLNNWGGSSEWTSKTYTIEDDFWLPVPSKPGFEFRGWTGEGVSTPTVNVNLSHQTGDRHYTAHWATKLKFHTNTSLMNGYLLNNEKGYGETKLTSSAYISGAQSSESNNTSDPVATLYEGTNYNINSAVNVKYNDKDINNSFIFAGWNTSPDGSGTWYGDRDSNGNYARVSGKTATGQFSWYGDVAGVDLYAQYYVKANLTYSGNHQTNSAKDYTTTINAGLIKNYGSFYFNKNTFERIEYATSFDAYEQADINKRYPYSYHGWSIDSNAYFKDARVYQPAQNVNTLNYIYECFQYGGENNINIQNGYVTITTYAVWDKYPVFTNKQDVSYPTDTVPNLTVDQINSDILKNIRVEDREDTASIYDNREIQYVKVLDVDLNELKSFKASTTVSATIEVKDSADNISHTKVNIILNKSTSGDVSKDPNIYDAYVTRYVRSISKDYIDKSHENGGLLKDSIWRTDPSYKQTLKEAVDEKTTPEQTFYISNQTRNEIRDFVNKNGIGNAVHGDALVRFNNEFKEKFKVKPQDKTSK